MQRAAQSAIEEAPASLCEDKDRKEDGSVLSTIKHHNIFHTILESSLPPSEKVSKRLGQEGFVTIAAGGETCGRMLTNALYYILTNRERVMPTLMKELKSVMPTLDVVPEWRRLEQLPYLVRRHLSPPSFNEHFPFQFIGNEKLSASKRILANSLRFFFFFSRQTGTIRETLRLSALLTSRLPLCAPFQTLQYQSYTIPPGHPISMSLRHVLHNESIFPFPMEFLPERWMPGDPNLERSRRFYVPFSRGTRGCVGVK